MFTYTSERWFFVHIVTFVHKAKSSDYNNNAITNLHPSKVQINIEMGNLHMRLIRSIYISGLESMGSGVCGIGMELLRGVQ